jgi:transcriptional regulator with XRE-family HTH domain
MLDASHSRAARGWLAWTQDDLAKKAGVSLSTVRDFEKGRRRPIANNIKAIEAALAEAGITFTDAGIQGPPQDIDKKAAGAAANPKSGVSRKA